nr:AMP-binding protein [Actinomadura sp. CNU-125]
MQLPNSAGFVVTFLALVRIGAAPVLALPAHRESEIGYLCELSGARAYAAADRDGAFDYRAMARTLPVEHVVIEGDAEEFTPLANWTPTPSRRTGPPPPTSASSCCRAARPGCRS